MCACTDTFQHASGLCCASLLYLIGWYAKCLGYMVYRINYLFVRPALGDILSSEREIMQELRNDNE